MPAPSWATPIQKEFLLARRIDFSQAQANKKLSTFWVGLYRDFFVRWPDQASESVDPTVEGQQPEKKKQKKKNKSSDLPVVELSHDKWVSMRKNNIYNWYNNHGLNKGRRSGKVGTVKISIASCASRLPTELHLYSKRYYETRVKAAVDAEIGDRNVDSKNRIVIINKHLAEIYGNESDEIKAEICGALEEERMAKEAAKEADRSIVNANDLTMSEIGLAQASLHEIIQDFFEAMEKRTTWAFTVLGGGRDPTKEGAIRTIGIHVGKNSYGQTFAKANPNYRESVLAPFSTFLHSVFSESERHKFTNDKADDTAVLPSTTSASDSSFVVSPSPLIASEPPSIVHKADNTAVLPSTTSASDSSFVVSPSTTSASDSPLIASEPPSIVLPSTISPGHPLISTSSHASGSDGPLRMNSNAQINDEQTVKAGACGQVKKSDKIEKPSNSGTITLDNLYGHGTVSMMSNRGDRTLNITIGVDQCDQQKLEIQPWRVSSEVMDSRDLRSGRCNGDEDRIGNPGGVKGVTIR
ncbi:hypothetical protein BYT27DRAFT_7264696 [Phlegmacium glaucopus]|nr:hypothetical protein BYT27DRAFT_7264696 [Phlegmacium glaucopus]